MHFSRCALSLVVSLVLLFVVACSGPVPGGASAVLRVSIADGPRSVAVGSTLTLSATVEGVGGVSEAVVWSGGDSAVATVSVSGVVSGVSVGEVQVTASSVVDPSRFDVATVSVVEAQSVDGVTINEPGVTLAVGSTADFTATVVATGAVSTAVVWSSSEAAIASVSAAGRVTAVSPGVTVITASSVFDASKSGTVAVAVEAGSVEPGVPASVSVVSGDGQSASVGMAVVIAPSVRVRDVGGNALAGISVSFSVTAGGGSVTPTSAVTTDVDGIARLAGWVLGSAAGTNNLSAVVTGSSPIISTSFSAVGTPGAASASTSTVVVSPTSLMANGTATSQITVRLKDAFGNNLTSGGAVVSFVTPSIGSIGGVSNNGDGTYSATYTAGTSAGTVTITPRVAGVAFSNTASITLSTAPGVTSVSIDQQSPSVMTGATLQFTATVATVAGASSAVTWSSSNTGVATINAATGVATGVASGSTTITATSTFDGSKSASVTLMVIAPAPMVLTVDTRLGPGTTVSLYSTGSIDVSVQWGDGTSSSATTSSGLSHTYVAEGEYQVRISGTMTHFSGGDRLAGIVAWGDIGLTSLFRAGLGPMPLPNSLPSSVTNLSHMFSGSEFNGDIGGWDTSNVTNMSFMFSENRFFNQDISAWDVSNVTTMQGMFWEALRFNRAIGAWDVSSVTNMAWMFEGSDGGNETSFNQDIGTWDVSSVTDMSSMFRWTRFNQDISRWDVSSVENMVAMFYASEFRGDVGGWNVSNVRDMRSMFAGYPEEPSTFNSDIGSWDVSRVTTMGGMFSENVAFNRDIGSWDVSNVTDMTLMFGSDWTNEIAFNQDISRWDVANVVNMTMMFSGAKSFNRDLSGWCVSQITSEPSGFADYAVAWVLPKPVWGSCP